MSSSVSNTTIFHKLAKALCESLAQMLVHFIFYSQWEMQRIWQYMYICTRILKYRNLGEKTVWWIFQFLFAFCYSISRSRININKHSTLTALTQSCKMWKREVLSCKFNFDTSRDLKERWHCKKVEFDQSMSNFQLNWNLWNFCQKITECFFSCR